MMIRNRNCNDYNVIRKQIPEKTTVRFKTNK